MKNIFKLIFLILLLLLSAYSCDLLSPSNKDEENNLTGYFIVNNDLGFKIDGVYAGDFSYNGEQIINSSTGSLTSGSQTNELQPAYKNNFNVWFKYYNETTNTNNTTILTDGNSILYDFYLEEGKRYYLDLYKDADLGESRFRFVELGEDNLPVVADPVITAIDNSITIKSSTPGVIIKFTTDGTIPSRTNGTLYNGSFTQSDDAAIRVIAYLENYKDSNIVMYTHYAKVMYDLTVTTPYFSQFTNDIYIYSSSGATIIYTLDGTTPSRVNGIRYEEPFIIDNDVTLKVFAFKEGYNDSQLLTENLTYRDFFPNITDFSIPVVTYSNHVDINTMAYFDDKGVVGYLIKLNDDITPDVNDDNWLTEEPTSFELPALGDYTVYLWVKDTYGNISFPEEQTVSYRLDYFQNYEALLTSTDNMYRYEVGDMNGDSLLDVVYTAYGEIRIDYQDSNNMFNNVENFSIDYAIKDMVISDINSDGLDDIVIVSSQDDFIAIYYQNINGTIDPMFTFPTEITENLRVGDVNSDGLKDIVGKNMTHDSVDIHYQNPDGSFTTANVISAPLDIRGELWIGDISGDGKSDIVVVDGQYYDPSIHILIQESDGSISSVQSTALVDTIYYSDDTNLSDVFLANFDDDDELEICISAGWYDDDAKIMLFNYSESEILEPISGNSYTNGPKDLYCADINNDGLTDIVYVNGYNNRIETLLNTPEDGFILISSVTSIHNVQDPILVDINGDGYVDLLTIGSSDERLAVSWGTAH